MDHVHQATENVPGEQYERKENAPRFPYIGYAVRKEIFELCVTSRWCRSQQQGQRLMKQRMPNAACFPSDDCDENEKGKNL